MTAPRDCRPPENTPDGTVCWLYDDALRRWLALPWLDGGWYAPSVGPIASDWMAIDGYRFHSIAEPPHE